MNTEFKEELALKTINSKKFTRDSVVSHYVRLIKCAGYTPGAVVERVNLAIIKRWSPSALIYIKNKAWKQLEKEMNLAPGTLVIIKNEERK